MNHFNNCTVSKYVSFRPLMKQCTLQFVPTFYKAGELPEDYKSDLNHVFARFAKDYDEAQNDVVRVLLKDTLLDYQVACYWHCGQTYTKSARYGQVLAPFSDHMHGALLQVNWVPVWNSGSVLEWLTDGLKEQWRDGVGVGKRKRGSDTSEGQGSGDPEELSLESLLEYSVATNYDVAYLVAHIADTTMMVFTR